MNPKFTGTKMAAMYELNLAAGETVTLRLRLSSPNEAPAKIVRSMNSTKCSAIASRRRMSFIDRSSRPNLTKINSASRGRRMPDCCGASSFIITS